MSDLHKKPLRDKIVDYVYDAIVNEEYKKKMQIREAHLANKLKVSRAPVREALAQLVSIGILEHVERKGVFVKEITSKDIFDTYEAKGVVEGFLASNFALYATQEDMDLLQHYVFLMSKSVNDSKKVVKIGELFHKHYLKYAKNFVFLETLERINKLSQILFFRNWTKLYTLDEITNRHQKIVDAVKSRNKKQIEEVIREHYFETGTKIILLREIEKQ
ncbi:MAG: GntR family transcriptional regulator [Sulfurospirillaceae bacterium]|nr:GntR family transcriptional regulator [Sulfurospirillaceae bacterium]